MFLKQNMLFFGVISGTGKEPGPKIKGYVYYASPLYLKLFSFFNININKN